ncbi:MAG: hypothetical protein M3094_04815, partial [Actinomycetia bacterium]|nr:hypothetical protein [Actinomycetes bacterium]
MVATDGAGSDRRSAVVCGGSTASFRSEAETVQVSIIAALFAGAASFLSPCVLPLLPGYISLMSGYDMN